MRSATSVAAIPLSLIVWWPIVDVLAEVSTRFRDLVASDGCRRYPEGSVEAFEAGRVQSVWDDLRQLRDSGLEIRQNTIFRSLACFPPRRFQLLSTWKYFETIGGERDFLVTPVDANWKVMPCELEPQKLVVRVIFLKTATLSQKTKFRDTLSSFFAGASVNGLFGEGPIQWREESLMYQKREAAFEIDASKSGQATLNWLVLTLLDLGARSLPITDIRFWDDPEGEAQAKAHLQNAMRALRDRRRF